MEAIMKCPYLKRWLVATCMIEDKIYVPSIFQLQEYCKTKGHKKCPFFMKNFSEKEEVNGRIPVSEYA
jgi:hypothetical protein